VRSFARKKKKQGKTQALKEMALREEKAFVSLLNSKMGRKSCPEVTKVRAGWPLAPEKKYAAERKKKFVSMSDGKGGSDKS